MRRLLKQDIRHSRQHLRRAAITFTTAITATVTVGFAALAVDLGYVRVARTQLQTAADASALAGASALIRSYCFTDSATQEALAAEAESRAIAIAQRNEAAGNALQLLPAEVTVGHIQNPQNMNEAIGSNAHPYNSVHVRIALEDGGTNSPISLMFARIWGKETVDVSATATAFLKDRVSGFQAKTDGSVLIPVTVYEGKWDDQIAQGNGEDYYGYDPVTGQITLGPDGIPEISIYPEKQGNGNGNGNSKGSSNTSGADNENSDGAGNFGLLNFENGNRGLPIIAGQIRNGLTKQNFMDALGSETIEFYSEDGSALTHEISGNPGLKAGLQDDFESKIGQVVGFFTHSLLEGPGANAVYTITGIQFGRVMEVNLHGSFNQKAIVIQPTGYTGSEVITGDNAPRHETAGRIQLIR